MSSEDPERTLLEWARHDLALALNYAKWAEGTPEYDTACAAVRAATRKVQILRRANEIIAQHGQN